MWGYVVGVYQKGEDDGMHMPNPVAVQFEAGIV